MCDSVSHEAHFESILKGQLPGAEMVIGLVGPVGADLQVVESIFTECLRKYRYKTQAIRVSELIERFITLPAFNPESEYERIDAMMTAGNNARKETKDNAVLALAAAFQIYAGREKKYQTKPRQACIINSLKHPDEVNALRRIYGNGFLLIGVYVTPEQRKHDLIHEKNMSPQDAEKLMLRDESEAFDHGQHTRETFHLSDFFLHIDENNNRTRTILNRFLDILMANPFRTPLFDEYAMFIAFGAATRSADLSRQIGAVIAHDDEILATGANECPRYGGGTYWPQLKKDGTVEDIPNGRDYKRGCDSNDEMKQEMIQRIIVKIRSDWEEIYSNEMPVKPDFLKESLSSSRIDDITEYGRVVHAEMDALLTCSRNNISCRNATLYTTTYPCHNCAKHIIAAGIKRVVYIEPYPKSKALDFHEDSVFAGFYNSGQRNDRVAFEPFVGVGPRRFFDLFSMKQGSGFPLKRKDKTTGKALPWEENLGNIRIPMLPWNYLEREEFATLIVKTYTKRDE